MEALKPRAGWKTRLLPISNSLVAAKCLYESSITHPFIFPAGTSVPKVHSTRRGHRPREPQGSRFGRASRFSWATPSATLELVPSRLLKAKEAAETTRRFSTGLNITPALVAKPRFSEFCNILGSNVHPSEYLTALSYLRRYSDFFCGFAYC